MLLIHSLILMLFCSGTNAAEFLLSRDFPVGDNDTLTDTTHIISPKGVESLEHKTLVKTIGFIYPEHAVVEHTKSINHIVYFGVTYKTGDFGLREINEKYLNTKSDYHFILAGDSFIFGDGVPEEHTVGVKISKFVKNMHVYNFGMSAGAPNNTLALMENYPWQKNIKEKKGIFVYNLDLGYMLQRVAGSKDVLSWHDGISPYYEIDAKGEPVRMGTFNDRGFVTGFYRFLNSFGWLKKLIPDLPRMGETQVILVTGILKKMKLLYLSQFPEGRFVVFIGGSKKLIPLVRNQFKKEEIDFIEFNPGMPRKGIFLHDSYDKHYNEKGYIQMASQFVSKLTEFNYIPQ